MIPHPEEEAIVPSDCPREVDAALHAWYETSRHPFFPGATRPWMPDEVELMTRAVAARTVDQALDIWLDGPEDSDPHPELGDWQDDPVKAAWQRQGMRAARAAAYAVERQVAGARWGRGR